LGVNRSDTYEKAGFYALGARALMRINRPHRAGMVFARAEMWTDAAKCFTTADMHEEAAKCYMQTGQFESAAKAYTSIEDFVNAAQAYAKFGAFRKASEAYSLAGDKVNATKQLKLALSSEGGMGTNWLNENELDLVENEAMRSGVSDSVFKALSGDPRLPAMVESLLKKKDFSRAKRLYQFADENARNSLIGKAVDGQLSQDDLIHFLRKVKDHVSLGYALQKLGQYAQAGFEFEQAKDWDLALSNYARAGSTQDVERIQKTKAGFDFGNVVSLQHNANDQVIGISENPRLVEMRLFKNVKSSLVGRVESIASQATLSAGEYMQSSTSGHEFVNFIVSGRIEALPLDGSSEQTLGRGDSFGHETLIGFSGGQTKYLATSNVLILQIKVSAFKSILDRDGNAAQQILKNSLLSLPEYRSKIV
jgi:tetratricopeptide (TPR) repeat protein